MSNSEYKEDGFTPDSLRKQAKNIFTPFCFNNGSRTMPFRMEFPHTLIPGKRYPLILLLHGAGSVGTDNIMPLFLAELYARHPLSMRGKAFILAPQCPTTPHWIEHGSSWEGLDYTFSQTPTSAMQSALDILDYVLDNFPVDDTRLAIGGCSMGGYGTWDMLSRRPGLFKAAFPICGGVDPRRVEDFRQTMLWFFHGSLDGTVRPDCSRRIAEALTAAHIDFKYTEFPNADHDSWTPAFARDDFHCWLNAALAEP